MNNIVETCPRCRTHVVNTQLNIVTLARKKVCACCGYSWDDTEPDINTSIHKIHAHIITNNMGDSRCSNCGREYIDATSNYCMECGAKFDKPAETD